MLLAGAARTIVSSAAGFLDFLTFARFGLRRHTKEEVVCVPDGTTAKATSTSGMPNTKRLRSTIRVVDVI